MQKNRLSISQEQRLFLLRELSPIAEGLNKELALEGISNEARLAVAGELQLVNDLIRKLEARSSYTKGTHY